MWLWQIPYLHRSRNRVNHEIMKSSLLCSVQYCILRDCGFVLILCVVFTACRMESQIPLSLSSPKTPDVVKRASKAQGEEPKMHNLETTTSRICSPMQSWLHCMEKVLGWFVRIFLINFTSSYPAKFPSKSSKDPTSVKVKIYWIPSWAEMAEAC